MDYSDQPCRVIRRDHIGRFVKQYESNGQKIMPRYVAERIARFSIEKHRGGVVSVEPVKVSP